MYDGQHPHTNQKNDLCHIFFLLMIFMKRKGQIQYAVTYNINSITVQSNLKYKPFWLLCTHEMSRLGVEYAIG